MPAAVLFTAIVRVPNGSASKPLSCSSSEISANTAIWLGVSSMMSGISNCCFSGVAASRCFRILSNRDTLMRHVLVDNPKSLWIDGENERVANLPERFER